MRKTTLTAASTIALAAALTLGATACSGTTTSTPPREMTSTVSIPPQPSPLTGAYTTPWVMAQKVQTAGIPLTDVDGPTGAGTDINGAHYVYGVLGTERIGLLTFDYVKVADDTEIQKRSMGRLTYRGNGWIVSAETPATLERLVAVLNK